MNNDIYTALSVVLLISGLYLYKKTTPSIATTSVFFVMVLVSILLFIAYGVADYFTGNGIDEATIYHLEYGLDGAGFLEYIWLIVIAIVALILGVFYLLWFILKRKSDLSSHRIVNLASFAFLSISLLLNPASIDLYNLQKNSSMSSEQFNAKMSDSFLKHYKKPYIQSVKNRNKNIVFIYAESLERTYFDQTIFPDLIKELRELESKSTYFTNIKQVAGTGWTIGGMTASQCGIPLFTPSHGNSMSGMDQFLSSAVCLGDLLNGMEYQLNYMGGARLGFAGKGKLFKTHGFTHVEGKAELLPKLDNKEYKTAWGLYDDSLLNLAYSRFIELSKSGEKFGLFTLTLDTHHPNGHPSKSCKDIKYKDGSNRMLNSVACSDYLISNFIKKIIKSPYADKTIVVLVSDHLAMRNSASSLLQKIERRNMFMIIDPSKDNFAEIKTLGSALDIGTTLLSFIGYEGEIGLGRNLLNNKNLEKERRFIHANLRKWRQDITSFWNFPKIQHSLEIDIDKKNVRIDDRRFKIPIFIELNDKLEAVLKFEFDTSGGKNSLVQHRKALSENKYFVLIDKCKNAQQLDNRLGENGFCLLAGQGKTYTATIKLDKNTTYTVKQIQNNLGIQ